MSFSRRNFIKFISLTTLTSQTAMLAGCTHQKFYNPDQDILLGGGRFKQNDELHHVLAVVNLTQKTDQQVDLDFLAHGIIIDPNNKKRLIAFAKNALNAVEIDLDNHAVTKNIVPGKNKIFNGHGAFNKTGNTLFCTETYSDTHKGVIAIRDGKSFTSLGELSSYGKNPHECLLIDDDATLVVTNTGSESGKDAQACVNYIDVQSQQLVERVTLSNQHLNAGHVDIANDGSLIVTSAARTGPEKTQPGGVSIRSGQQTLLSMTQPEVVIDKMNGEALSIAIDEMHNIAAVTHPDANMITFWSIDKRELIKAISVAQPRGITLSLDGKSYIVSYNINTSLVLIDTKNLTANTDSIMQPSYMSGEHIYNWSKTLTEIMPADIYS